MKNFHQVSFFFSISSHHNSLHPLRIILCIVSVSTLIIPLFSTAAVVASISLLFLLNLNAPPTLQLTNNSSKRRLKRRLNAINAGSIVPRYNSSAFHLHAELKCADILAGIAKGPSQPLKGPDGEKRHTSKVSA